MTIDEWLTRLRAAAAQPPSPAPVQEAARAAAQQTFLATVGKTRVAVTHTQHGAVVTLQGPPAAVRSARRLLQANVRTQLARARGTLVAEMKARLS